MTAVSVDILVGLGVWTVIIIGVVAIAITTDLRDRDDT